MLFLAGLGSTHPLIPEVPSRNPVPRGPSGRVPRGWDGRVPAVPGRLRVPERGLDETMLVAYPTYEPTFAPPPPVRADWKAPQMHMMNGLGAVSAEQGRAALQHVYNITLKRLEPFMQWMGDLPEGSRGDTVRLVLDRLRPGGGGRVHQTFRALVAGGVAPPNALRRALAKEFAASVGNPAAATVEILRSQIGVTGLGDWMDDVRGGLNSGGRVVAGVSCNEGVQNLISAGMEWASDGDVTAEATESVLETTCKVADTVHKVTETGSQRQSRLAREAAAQRQQPQVGTRQPPQVGTRQPPRRRPMTRRQLDAAAKRWARELRATSARGGDEWAYKFGKRASRTLRESQEALKIGPLKFSDRDIVFMLARRAPVNPDSIHVPEEKSNMPLLLAGGAAVLFFGYRWMKGRKAAGGSRVARGPVTQRRASQAVETLV